MFFVLLFFITDDSEDERVGEVSVERELHHVPPQLQKLHRLSQTHKDVTTVKEQRRQVGQTRPAHSFYSHLQFKIPVSDHLLMRFNPWDIYHRKLLCSVRFAGAWGTRGSKVLHAAHCRQSKMFYCENRHMKIHLKGILKYFYTLVNCMILALKGVLLNTKSDTQSRTKRKEKRRK